MANNSDETARRIVGNEVRYCVSPLIYAAFQNWEQATALGFGEDDLTAIASRRADVDDYRDCAPASLKVQQDEDEWKWKDGHEAWSAGFPSELDAFRDAFDTLRLDEPDGCECLEHWLVTDWLAEKLEAKGEAVTRDSLGLTVWGRCTSGQAIYADHVIQEIARDLDAS